MGEIKTLKKYEELDWVHDTICHLCDYKQMIQYAVFAAEQVIDVFENKYPDDKGYIQTIKDVKKCIDNPSEENLKSVDDTTTVIVKTENSPDFRRVYSPSYFSACTALASKTGETYWVDKAIVAAIRSAAEVDKEKIKLKILKYGLTLLKKNKKDISSDLWEMMESPLIKSNEKD